MEKEFIPYEQALALKELGFVEKCYRGYDKNQILFYSQQDSGHLLNYSVGMNVSAPLYQQAFRWFRDKYNIDGFIRIEPLNEKYGFVIYNREKDNFKEFSTDYTKTEDAELSCLIKLIEIVKKPKKY
jgi:hypothetical protein